MLTVLRKYTLEALESMHAYGPFDSYLGICGNVTQHFANLGIEWNEEDLDMILDPLFDSWPDRSCSPAYPVGNWRQTPSKLFWAFHDNRRDMWSPSTRYGKARIQLLCHMIKELNQ